MHRHDNVYSTAHPLAQSRKNLLGNVLECQVHVQIAALHPPWTGL